ncbi:hypothetical protein EK904_012754 [Melospiza melodia maxima]|nr:hypothetical protein EK904_012754 [Melospiza melodia maxima]
MIMNSANNKEVDILRMLTKAKDEYTKCKTCSEPKQITSSSAIYSNPNLIKPIPVKPSETQQQQQRISQQSKNADPEPQHLSLTALFGKQDKADGSEALSKQPQESVPARQGVVRSLSYEEPSRHSPGAEKQLCPAIQKLMVISPQRIPATASPTLLMSPMVFAQPTPAAPKAAESGRLGSAEPGSGSLLLPLPAEAAVPCSASVSKVQLQETLLHLIQNDDNFLNIIYEAYLFSVRKAAMKKPM